MYQLVNGEWILLGSEIDPSVNGEVISISGDGMRLVIAQSFHLYLYERKENNSWNFVGKSSLGLCGILGQLKISRDGNFAITGKSKMDPYNGRDQSEDHVCIFKIK